MQPDEALKRSAAVIMWHVRNGGDVEYAVAKAHEREPQLTDGDMKTALEWAQAALRFADVFKAAPASCTIGTMCRAAGLPSGVKRDG